MSQSCAPRRLNLATLVAAILFALACASALVAFAPAKTLAAFNSTGYKIYSADEYQATVQAYANGELGPKSDPFTFTTKGLLPGEIDINPRAAVLDEGEKQTFQARYAPYVGEEITDYQWFVSTDGETWTDGIAWDEALGEGYDESRDSYTLTLKDGGSTYIKCKVTVSGKQIDTPVARVLNRLNADSYRTNSVTPTFYPLQVENLTLSSTATTMEVSWPLLESVDTYEITYRASGDDPAAAKTIRVSSQDSSETLNHYSVTEGQATYTLEGLAPGADYHVSIVGSKLGEQSESKRAAETRTFPAPAAPTIAEQPSSQFADLGSTDEITFTAAMAKPAQGEISAQLERYVPGADGAEGTWEKAADVTVADDESVEGIARLTAVLTPSNETSWRYVDAARLRFSVTNSLNGATTTAQSDTVNLVILSVQPSEVVETTTIKKNTLTAVTVTPERTVAQDGTTVELSALPTFDGEGAKASYVWQWYTADEGWQNIPDAANASTYTATVGEANASAYRCIMTTGGALNPAMEEKSVTSNRAVVWNDVRPHDPADLKATPQVATAELTWTGDESLVGSYAVEYRVAGDKEWRTIYSDVASCSIVDLEPSTTYEWRVTAKGDNGLTSATVDGPTFATLTGSVLTKAQTTPSKTDVTMKGDWKSRTIELSVRDDADSAEEKDYTWQYSDDGGTTWQAIDGAKASLYQAPVPTFVNDADEECVGTRLYHCIVTATVNNDTAEVASSTASVCLVPSAPTDANLVDAMYSTAGLTWKAPESAVPCGYEVEYRKQGASDWAPAVVQNIKVAADGTVSCRMVALKSSTAYEWRVRAVGIPAGADDPDPAYASAWTDGVSFVTPAFSGLNTAVVTPQVALYDPADEGAVRFEVKTDATSGQLVYEWQWQETSADESEDTAWKKVADYASDGQLVPSGSVLEVKKEFRDNFPSARFRCVVSTNSSTPKIVKSSSAVMVGRLTAPRDLEAKDVSLNGAKLTWADSNPYEGTYTLQYRAVGQPVSIAPSVPGTLPGLPLLAGGQSLFTSIDPSGWMTVSGIEAKEYSLTGKLVPGTTYEWRVWFVSNAGGVDGPVSDGPVFTTPESSALQGVVVTPKVAVGDVNDEVTFTAVTNVDASEDLKYQWYTAPRGSNEFKAVLDATGKSLTVSVGEDDLGTQYQCEVSATKNGDPKKVTSEPVSVWKRVTIAEPANLQATPTATTADLSWTCDNAQMAGTFTVEYRASDGVWQTVNNVEDTTLALTGLKPAETYEWRVAHVVGDVVSKFVESDFTTLEGSALTSVTVTPASVTTAPFVSTRLIATTNAEASGEKLSYQWQQIVEPGGGNNYWDDIHTEDSNYYYFDAFASDHYDISSYRCVVTAEKNGDVKTITGAEVQVIAAPEAPIYLLADGIETHKAQLSWTDPGRNVDQKTHEVAWRVQGGDEWNTVLIDQSTRYELTGLEPSTTYEWRVRTMADDQSVTSEWSDISSFITLGESSLSEAVVAPVLLRYDTVSGEDAKFKVSANANGNLTYQWQWKPADGDWQDADDTTKFEVVDKTLLTVKKDFAQSSEAQGASFQCVVSTGDGVEPITVTSNPAVLAHRVAAPTDLDTIDRTTSSATFSWNDMNTYEGAYTLQYRPSAVSTESAAGGENWTTVSEDIVGDGSGTTTYTVTNLNPDTIYEWRVRFVTELGGVEGAWAEGTFRTLPGSAIKWVEVSPAFTVGEAQETVELQAATNVDYLPGEALAYQWQIASRGSDEWTNVEGGTNATLTATVGDADTGVRYRCMVTATKNGHHTELASNEAVIWTRSAVAVPDNLAVSNLAMTGATLSWTCDAKVPGTFTVEYCGSDGVWHTVRDVAEKTLELSGLKANETYQWRVSHVVGNGFASEFVEGSFRTLEGSALTSVTVTPASVSYDTVQGGDVVFTVQTDTTGETFIYQWQWKSADGDWQDVAGNENFAVADDGTLTVREAFAKSDAADGASFQCIVSTPPTAEPRTVTSSPALLTHRPPAPIEPKVDEVAMDSATVTWTDTQDGDGTYTLEYRKASAARARAAAENWITKEGIARDASGTTSFTIDGLEEGAHYEWRVKFVEASGAESSWIYGAPFTTLSSSTPDPEDPDKPTPEDPDKPQPEDPDKPTPEDPDKPSGGEPSDDGTPGSGTGSGTGNGAGTGSNQQGSGTGPNTLAPTGDPLPVSALAGLAGVALATCALALATRSLTHKRRRN